MTSDSIITSLGGTSELARTLGLSASQVSNWRARGKIPAEFWSEIVRLADERAVDGVTLDALAEIHARREPVGARP